VRPAILMLYALYCWVRDRLLAVRAREVEQEDWAGVKDGAYIALVHVPGRRSYEILGDRPTVHIAVAIVPFIITALLVLGYWVSRQSILPWYERKVEERGSGRLPDASEQSPKAEPAVPQ
jgi:hypothetical protein